MVHRADFLGMVTDGGRPGRRPPPTLIVPAVLLLWLLPVAAPARDTTSSATASEILTVQPATVNLNTCADTRITLRADVTGYQGWNYGVKVGDGCPLDTPDDTGGKPACTPGVTGCCEVLDSGVVGGGAIVLDEDSDGDALEARRFVDCDGGGTGSVRFVIVLTSSLYQPVDDEAVLDYRLQRPPAPTIEENPVAGETTIRVRWRADRDVLEEFKACAVQSDLGPIDTTTTLESQRDRLKPVCSSTDDLETTITDLQVGIRYLVTVVGYDEAGNESLPAAPLEVVTTPITDFWEYYRAAGGVEEGGYCATVPLGTARRGVPSWTLLAGGVLFARALRCRRGARRHRGRGRWRPSLLAAVLGAGVALGTGSPARAGESPRTTLFDFRVGSYLPAIDSEWHPSAGGGRRPYEAFFGKEGLTRFDLDLGYHLFDALGTLTVGLGIGYGSVEGKGFLEGTTQRSLETTAFRMLPLHAFLAYSLDFPALWWGFPLVPYAKVGGDYVFWWVENGSGDTASASGRKGSGGTHGYHYALGLRLLLDALSPDMARDFDNEMGVNNSYLTVEYVVSDLDDLDDPKSMDLSSSGSFSFGLAFDF